MVEIFEKKILSHNAGKKEWIQKGEGEREDCWYTQGWREAPRELTEQIKFIQISKNSRNRKGWDHCATHTW